MAFPGRPAMVPGIPLPSGMAYMPPMLPSVMTMPPIMPVRPFRPRNSSHKMFAELPRKGQTEAGPTITVFIGNIVEHAPDLMIKHILATCGQVISWKRIQGFGFCEFGSPMSALRAIRILHDMGIGSKKLVVKVDANTTVKLNEYKKAQRSKQGKPDLPSGANEDIELEDYIDEQSRHADRRCQNTIYQILHEFHEEMENALIEKKEEIQFNKEIIQNLPDPNRAQKSQDLLSKLASNTEKGVGKEDIEDGKRELITREIGKFREIMKKQEAEREEERLRREQERQQEKADVGRTRSRSRSLSSVRSVRSARSPLVSKASTPEARHRSKIRRVRSHSRSRDRERERDRERDRERERERDQPKPRQSKRDLDRAAAREVEEEEEAKERKKLDKKTREKEVAYQERVRMWESRERRKRKDFEREKERKLMKEEEMAKEAKKLKEFLEDYDDERDDGKFYKGRELQRRMTDRDRERESDDKDRLREKEEIEELRNKVLESEHSDPTGVYEQLLQEHENQYKPKIIIDVNAEQMIRQREREKEREKERQAEMRALEEEKRRKEAELLALNSGAQLSNDVSPSDDDDDRGDNFGAMSNNNSPSDNEEHANTNSVAATAGKKKKLDLKDVFNADEDEESAQGPKKRKLVPLDYDDKDKSSTKDKDHKKKDHHRKDDKKGDENSKSTEEKRKHVKSLIDKIPTDKGALFEYTIDWTMVDNILMEKRIRPWINKKIIEYIGEPEPTLVDFICSKVLAGSQPQGILDDVQMVLDEEAEIFVVKMWRLLIYEIEAKKMGFVK